LVISLQSWPLAPKFRSVKSSIDAIRTAFNRSKVVIICGGLGPPIDDMIRVELLNLSNPSLDLAHTRGMDVLVTAKANNEATSYEDKAHSSGTPSPHHDLLALHYLRRDAHPADE
jgi:hypothetical protein